MLTGPVLTFTVKTLNNDLARTYPMRVVACIESGKFCATVEYDLYIDAHVNKNENAPTFQAPLPNVKMDAGTKVTIPIPDVSELDSHGVTINGFSDTRSPLWDFITISNGAINIEPGFDVEGTHVINIRLQDDGDLPMGTNNQFILQIFKNKKEEEIDFWSQNVAISDSLDVAIESIDSLGYTRIRFNEPIMTPFNITDYDSSQFPLFGLKLFRESNQEYIEDAIASWDLIEFAKDYIDIKVVWSNPLEISI